MPQRPMMRAVALILQRQFGASTGLATIAHTDTSPEIWRQYSSYRHVPMASVVVVLLVHPPNSCRLWDQRERGAAAGLMAAAPAPDEGMPMRVPVPGRRVHRLREF